jgi:hypothetical protein
MWDTLQTTTRIRLRERHLRHNSHVYFLDFPTCNHINQERTPASPPLQKFVLTVDEAFELINVLRAYLSMNGGFICMPPAAHSLPTSKSLHARDDMLRYVPTDLKWILFDLHLAAPPPAVDKLSESFASLAASLRELCRRPERTGAKPWASVLIPYG